MPVKQQRKLSAVLSAMVLGAVFPHVLGQWYTVVLLLALPLVTAAVCAMKERAAGLVGIGCLALWVLPVMPESLAIPSWLLVAAVLWLALNAAALLLSDQLSGKRLLIYWGYASLMTVITALVTAMYRYDGLVTDGLAASICARIDALPVLQKPQVLVMLYQSGLARLDTETARLLAAGVKVAGVLGVSPEIQQQLLWSFRTTLEKSLPALLPELLVQWGLLMTLLSGLVKDSLLRWRTGKGQLPPFYEWHMPTPLGRMALVLMLLGAIQLFTGNAALAQMAIMCRTLGYWAFAVQGAALLCHGQREHGASNVRCGVLAAIALLLVPFVLMLIGLYDQFRDPRGLREDMQHDEDDDQGGYDI